MAKIYKGVNNVAQFPVLSLPENYTTMLHRLYNNVLQSIQRRCLEDDSFDQRKNTYIRVPGNRINTERVLR